MKTNHYFLLIAISFISHFSIAQTSFSPPSQITDIVVYEQGAMVTRSINTTNVTNGGSIIIDSLPQGISPKSLQVNSGNRIKIISVKYEIKQEKSEQPKALETNQNEILKLQDSIQYQNTIASSLIQEIGVIESNKDFKTDQGVNIDQVSKASELYKAKLRALKIEQLDIKLNIRRLNNKIYALNIDNMDLTVKTYNNHKAIIKIENPTNGNRELTISYFTSNATWYSFYDLRVGDDKSKNVLDHKAYVSQSTGEDWNNVKLTLSNRNPQKRISPPVLEPYRLQNINHRKHGQYNQEKNNTSRIILGKVIDSSGEALIGASISIKGNNYGTVSDIDGFYSIQTQNRNKIIVSYVGYETKEVNIQGKTRLDIVLHEGNTMDEIVVTGLGVNKSKKALGYAVTAKSNNQKIKKQERKSITIKEQQSLNVSSFEILTPYTIPSDSKEYDVLLKSSTIPFEFNYLIYPSIEPIAYLNVGIPEWKDYNLFSGHVNLFLGGQYTGVSNIDISESSDTLWFSLGEDIGVNVERNPVKEYNKKSFFKNKTIELHTFDIEIKNNKNNTINMSVMDQVPISTDEEIEVKVLEISKANYEEESGYLKWEGKLNISEKKKYRISYEIKYGKNIKVVN